MMLFFFLQLSLQFFISINGRFPVDATSIAAAAAQIGLKNTDITKIEIAGGIFPQSQFINEAENYSIMNEYPNLESFSTTAGTIENNELPPKAFYHSSIKSVSISSLVKVGKSAFYNCTSLESFTSESLETVGINAFRFCHNLTSLSFPNLKKIDNYGFMNCSQLSSISIPNVEYIGSNAFQRNFKLVSLEVPKCTFVGTEAFRQTKLTSITLSPNLNFLGEGAFYNVSTLTGDLTFNELTVLKASTFQSCSSLKSVTIPKVTQIGDHCFAECTSLTTVNAPLATVIGYNAFSKSGIVTVTIPNVETLKSFSFYNSTINSFSASELTDLGRHSFRDCTSLTTVSIPKITDIKYSTFSNCSKLTTLTVGKLKSIASFAFRSCPLESLDLTEVTIIGNFSLYGCPFETVEAPLVTQLGESALAYSPNLVSVNMPKLEYINNSCFAYSEKFNMDINYPDLKYVGDYAFTHTKIKSFYSPVLISAGERAFEECHELTTAYIAETCGFIGFSLFFNCNHLINCSLLAPVYLDDRPNILMHSPLQYLRISTRINVLNIPNMPNSHKLIVSKTNNTCPQPADGKWKMQSGTTEVDYDAFKWCGKIKELTITDTLQTIHERGFKEMTNLEIVRWFNVDSSKLEVIEAEAFSSCTKLSNFTIPFKVNKVGENIFKDDSALKTIYVHPSFPLSQYEANLKQGNNAAITVLDSLKLLNEANHEIKENTQTKKSSPFIVAAVAVVAVIGLAISVAIVSFKKLKAQEIIEENEPIL
ncbi:hypothetical protein M9Y10_009170 [Tritrichomonas musculus]|uniref:Surface antigen BspA-like n=1 Tax=Tritrichomonas musculus TaxID=1915356 RepID=A0ABR2IMP5_9EUKA